MLVILLRLCAEPLCSGGPEVPQVAILSYVTLSATCYVMQVLFH